jgi:dihydroorotate dehydrogenase (NAD+) catalytic subunit
MPCDYNYGTLDTKIDLSIQIAPHNRRGLLLANPVIAASGTFGYGEEMAGLCDIQSLGAIICKGTTLKPREGNRQPRIAETPSGMLNAIGLQNIGVDALIREKSKIWAGWKVPVIVNIAGETLEEYAELARKLDGVQGISGLEINISCPNVASGCMEFGANPESAGLVTSAVKNATSLPIIVKLTPNACDIVAVAKAVCAAGADAISLVNTLKGMAIDTGRRKPVLGNKTGGLSGPAIKPIALYMVYQVSEAVDVPVIGGGGIATTQDALEFIMAGASAVEVGTATFINPCAGTNIIKGLEDYVYKNKIKFGDLIGAAHS